MSARGLGEALLSLFWKDNRLSIFDISVRQEKLILVQGSAELPLLAEVQHPDRLIPNDEPLKLALQARELDLRKLFTQLGQKKPPLTGKVNLDVNAGGTLDELSAKATLRATAFNRPMPRNSIRQRSHLISISRMTGCLSMGLFSKG